MMIQLSPREADMFSLALPVLKQEGFVVEPFGPQTWAIRTVPVTLGRSIDPGEVREIIGRDKLIFAPGLGPQGGDPEKAFIFGANEKGEALIVSASRSINYAYEALNWPKERFAEAAAEEARRERNRLNEIKRKVLGGIRA